VFDLLWLNGRDLRPLPLSRRKKQLERLVPATVGALNRVPCFEEEGRELFDACSLDLEGIVSKRKGRMPTNLKPGGSRLRMPLTRRRRGEESCSSATVIESQCIDAYIESVGSTISQMLFQEISTGVVSGVGGKQCERSIRLVHTARPRSGA
jgi:hypothetical protein